MLRIAALSEKLRSPVRELLQIQKTDCRAVDQLNQLGCSSWVSEYALIEKNAVVRMEATLNWREALAG